MLSREQAPAASYLETWLRITHLPNKYEHLVYWPQENMLTIMDCDFNFTFDFAICRIRNLGGQNDTKLSFDLPLKFIPCMWAAKIVISQLMDTYN